MYFLVAGFGVTTGTERYLSQTRAKICAQGLDGILPSKLAEQCSVLFTWHGALVTRTASGYAILAGLQVSRYDMSQIHRAVINGAPDSMANAASFDMWWDSLPIDGS